MSFRCFAAENESNSSLACEGGSRFADLGWRCRAPRSTLCRNLAGGTNRFSSRLSRGPNPTIAGSPQRRRPRPRRGGEQTDESPDPARAKVGSSSGRASADRRPGGACFGSIRLREGSMTSERTLPAAPAFGHWQIAPYRPEASPRQGAIGASARPQATSSS